MMMQVRLWLLLFLLSITTATLAQVTNDGFLRRDGTMHLIRNGEVRPMPHDVHLPNGRTVSRDGFILEPNGQRTALAEGQGCTVRGNLAVVSTVAGGRLQLSMPAAESAYRSDEGGPGRSRWAGSRGKGHKKHGKRKGWKRWFED